MNEAFARTVAALELALRLSLPVLAVAFVVALVVALAQGFFRLAEPTLNAIPRAVATLLVLGAVGPWLASELVAYTLALFQALPELVR
jgi:flagellar biosynthetic protein FliQ